MAEVEKREYDVIRPDFAHVCDALHRVADAQERTAKALEELASCIGSRLEWDFADDGRQQRREGHYLRVREFDKD